MPRPGALSGTGAANPDDGGTGSAPSSDRALPTQPFSRPLQVLFRPDLRRLMDPATPTLRLSGMRFLTRATLVEVRRRVARPDCRDECTAELRSPSGQSHGPTRLAVAMAKCEPAQFATAGSTSC